jgi:hypothetical protein
VEEIGGQGGGLWGWDMGCTGLVPTKWWAMVLAVLNIRVRSRLGADQRPRIANPVESLHNKRCAWVYSRMTIHHALCVHNSQVLAEQTNVLACCLMIPSYQTARHEKD